jgi:hypothetical protein
MTLVATEAPVFVKAYRPDQGGTDFLGLRQVNVDIMDACLPGINNVSDFVRPFSVISWIYWKFHQLAAAEGAKKVSETELKIWQEKVEILFTWGISSMTYREFRADSRSRLDPGEFLWISSRGNESLAAQASWPPCSMGRLQRPVMVLDSSNRLTEDSFAPRARAMNSQRDSMNRSVGNTRQHCSRG